MTETVTKIIRFICYLDSPAEEERRNSEMIF